jgi:hypothetical protein
VNPKIQYRGRGAAAEALPYSNNHWQEIDGDGPGIDRRKAAGLLYLKNHLIV